MAKNSFPMMPTGGSGALGKAVRVMLLVAVIVLVVEFPNDAASFVQDGTAWLGGAISGLVTFLRALGR